MFSSDEGHEGTGDGEDIQDALDIVQDAEPVPGQTELQHQKSLVKYYIELISVDNFGL